MRGREGCGLLVAVILSVRLVFGNDRKIRRDLTAERHLQAFNASTGTDPLALLQKPILVVHPWFREGGFDLAFKELDQDRDFSSLNALGAIADDLE